MTESAAILQILQAMNANIGNLGQLSGGYLPINNPAFTGTLSGVNETLTGTLAVTGHTTFEGVTSTGATGTGKIVYATSPTLVTPVLGAAIATSLAFNPTTGGIIGTTTNDSVGSGFVGEYISSNIASGSAVSLVSGAPKTVTSISLTGGDWDVLGTVGYLAAGSTTTVAYGGAVNTVTNALPLDSGLGAYALYPGTSATGIAPVFPVGTTRISVAAPTTIYLVAYGNFSVSTATAYGFIGARRVR